MRPLLLPLLILLSSCAPNTTGYVMTRDRGLVAETAEVSRDEFARRLSDRAATAAGKDWIASATIRELPLRDEVKADEWGWKTLSIDLVLTPPRGASTAGAAARAEEAVREAAVYRVHRSSDIAIHSIVRDPAAPIPGSTRYTTVAGDTLAGISTAFYGTSQHWRLIADANPGLGALTPGTELVIPPKP